MWSTGRGDASWCKTRPLAVRPHSAIEALLVPRLRSNVQLVDVVGPVGVPGLLGVAGTLPASASPCTGAFSMYLCTNVLTCRPRCCRLVALAPNAAAMAIPPRLIEWPPQLCLPSVPTSGKCRLCPSCARVPIKPYLVNGPPADVGKSDSEPSRWPTASLARHTGQSPRPT
eukprot:138730-Amphidinium_carterae.4